MKNNMDVWLLGLFLGYKNLPERAGELWDEMRLFRKEIAKLEVRNPGTEKIAYYMNLLTPREIEFRGILIEYEKKKYE